MKLRLIVFILWLSNGLILANESIIDFENGVDRQKINVSIDGVQFKTTNGQDWIFLDMREGYNTDYHVDGNFAAWLGANQGSGRIDFDKGVATKVSVGYAAQSGLYLEAYDASGNMVDSENKSGNLGTGSLNTLTVEAPNISYVIIHDSGNRWLIDNFKFELADVQLLELDLQEDLNEPYHHTQKYEDNVVFRRADYVAFNIVTTPDFDSQYYELELIATNIKDNIDYVMTNGVSTHDTEWHSEFAEVDKNPIVEYDDYSDYAVIPAVVHIPNNLPIGKYKFSVKLKRKNGKGEVKTISAKKDAYIIFNPWSLKDDDVYGSMSDAEKYAYVLKEEGKLYVSNNAYAKNWNFTQFSKVVFEKTLNFIEKLSLSDRKKGWVIARHLSAVSNSLDNNGVLVGNWTGNYSGGKSPQYWSNSKQIFDIYNSSVKYGQCWVFSGVLNSMLRSIGIPARSITNVSSAHDKNGDGILKTLEGDWDGTYSNNREYGDSIWNFHVWNEAWLNRNDRISYKSISWQAVDGTPQEKSDGLYRAGPAPVSAIKDISVHNSQYDIDFIRSEVQAFKEIWTENWFGTGVTQVGGTTNHRSKGMYTTDANGNRINVVTSYCSDCKTSNNSNKMEKTSNKTNTIGVYTIEVDSIKTAILGSTYSGKVSITNNGTEGDIFSTRILMLAKSSNGQILEKWGELIKSDIELDAGSKKEISFNFIVPMSKKVMLNSDSFSIESAVIGKKYTGYGELAGEIVAMDSNLTVSTVASDSTATVTLKANNHTSVNQNTNFVLTLPTGVTTSDNLVQTKTIGANSIETVTWAINVPKTGKYHITTEVKPDELAPLYNSKTIEVLKKEDYSLIVNTPKFIQLGESESAEVNVTNQGSEPLDLTISISSGSGIDVNKQTIQVSNLLTGKSFSEILMLEGTKVGKYAFSTFSKLTTTDGSVIKKNTSSVVGVQGDSVKTLVSIEPNQIQYSGSGEVNVELKISTDSSSSEDVKISSSASDTSIRYSIYDGTQRILNQNITVDSGTEKILTLKIEDSQKSGKISITATPLDNPYGISETSLALNIGQNPVANAGEDQTVSEGEEVTLSGTTSTDPDGDGTIAQYTWTQISGSAVTLTPINGSSTDIKFTLDSVGSVGEELYFRLTITDNTGLTSSDEVIVKIENVNQAPIAVTDVVSVLQGKETVITVLSNDTDNDFDTLSISDSDEISTQDGVVQNNNGTLSYTSKMNFEGTDSFTYTVSDGNGGTAIGTVTVTVTERNYDFDEDNDVDIDDIVKVSDIWNTKIGEANYDATYDFNSDGVIDIKDIMLIASKWGI